MIPPSLARLIEKWRDPNHSANEIADGGKICADELSAALQSMTAEEPQPVAFLWVASDGERMVTFDRPFTAYTPLYSVAHPPLVAAKEIEGATESKLREQVETLAYELLRADKHSAVESVDADWTDHWRDVGMAFDEYWDSAKDEMIERLVEGLK